jgi:flagellar hook assembly protein FlgD
MGTRSVNRKLVFVIAAAVLLVVVAPAATAWAATVQVLGASTLDGTHVKISFNQVVGASATNPADYAVSPALTVSSAVLTDGDNAVLLTTAAQIDATLYTVSVSGVAGLVPTTQRAAFVGTVLGPASPTSFQDDFNRPSGFLPTDTPISGLWTAEYVSLGNDLGLVSAPTLAGSGALRSRVSSLDPEADNASLQYAISASEYYLSAYVNIPSGQYWGADQQVGLLRLNQYPATAQARITAFAESSSAYTLKVNWKESSSIGYHGDMLVATRVTFGGWHWLQLHVKNGAAGIGEVQVFVDGRLAYSQNTIAVQPVQMSRAEVGIMHMASTGPAGTTYTDEVRMGAGYQLPSVAFDAVAPTGVAVTSPAEGSLVTSGLTTLAATATDNVGVQRVAFVVDGTVVAADDSAPYSFDCSTLGLTDGQHTVVARAYDTSGLMTESAPLSFSVLNKGPDVLTPEVGPDPFSPNGDGYEDTATISFATSETAQERVLILDPSMAVKKTLLGWTSQPAGSYSLSWNGTYYAHVVRKHRLKTRANVLVADGAYTVRIEAKDALGRVTTVDRPLVVNRVLWGVGRSRSTFSPNGDGSADTVSISYALQNWASVGIAIEKADGTPVRTVQKLTYQIPGGYGGDGGVDWDGRDDDGNVVPDGEYTIRVWAVTAVGRTDNVRTVTVDTVAPTLSLDEVSPDPWDTSLGPLTVAFTASEAGSASVKFYLGAPSASSWTATASLAAGGATSVTWDGLLADGSAAPVGLYTVRVYFTDKAANHSIPYPASAMFQLTHP